MTFALPAGFVVVERPPATGSGWDLAIESTDGRLEGRFLLMPYTNLPRSLCEGVADCYGFMDDWSRDFPVTGLLNLTVGQNSPVWMADVDARFAHDASRAAWGRGPVRREFSAKHDSIEVGYIHRNRQGFAWICLLWTGEEPLVQVEAARRALAFDDPVGVGGLEVP